jgi:hypothetical protein
MVMDVDAKWLISAWLCIGRPIGEPSARAQCRGTA